MLKPFLGSLAFLVFSNCATVPIEQHKCYDSTLDYFKKNKNEECRLDPNNSKLFEESKPVTARKEYVEITYVGDSNGNGYCLTPSFNGVSIRTYCTLDSNLYACIFTDVIEGEVRKVVQLRSENPSGCNRQPWNVLDAVFEQAKYDFFEGESSDPNYSEARRRVLESL